eukprot:jgi/Undpi1/4761/HiC_scaffold_18.g08114.m1
MIVFHLSVAVWIALTLAVGGVRGTTSPPSSAVVEPSRMTDIPMGITREALLEQALGLQRNQEFDAAAAMYVSLLEAIPNDPDGLHRLGLVLYSQGKMLRNASGEDHVIEGKTEPSLFEKSERLVRASIQFVANRTEDLMMRGNLGELLRIKGDLLEAEVELRAVLEEGGDQPNPQASLTLATTLINMIDRGVWTLSRHPEDGSSDGSERRSIERSDERGGGRTEWAMRLEAVQLLKAHMEHSPDSKYVAVELALFLTRNWDRHLEGGKISSGDGVGSGGSGGGLEGEEHPHDWGEEARYWFERAVHIDPSDAAITFELAVVLHRQGRHEAARDLYEKILDMEGASQGATRHLTRSHMAVLKQEMGDFEGAVKEYRQVIVDLPENAALLNNMGSALLTLGKVEEGASMLRQSIEIDPTQHDVLVNLGTHLQEEGDLDGAKVLYTKAERLRRNDGLAIRHAIMLKPILGSEEEILLEKDHLHRAVNELIARNPPLVIPDPIRGVERVHFYLVYRGGNHRQTQRKIARLDVLVYADMNSEPVSHFLGYARLAKVQAVFWGNPITTGNPSIDYFVSAAVLEGQNRTALSDEDEPYSEQSVFKLRPGFDLILRDILRAFNSKGHRQNAYLVLTEGRRKSWTNTFWRRLQRSIPDVIDQVKILPRTSAGNEFHTLLASADVILHPFPFGGSKTAADGLSLGVPVVAMEGDALPGRMAFSLYKTMGMEGKGDQGCCVANDRESYVKLAIRLGQDSRYRQWAGDLIGRRSSALWERRDVVVEWARFLSKASGRPAPTALEAKVGLIHGADLPLPPPPPFQRNPQQPLNGVPSGEVSSSSSLSPLQQAPPQRFPHHAPAAAQTLTTISGAVAGDETRQTVVGVWEGGIAASSDTATGRADSTATCGTETSGGLLLEKNRCSGCL